MAGRQPPEVDRAAALRELTAQRLLPAAERLLEEKAWTDITVDELATEAGVSRTLFYNHFDDKSHLLQVLTTDVMDRLTHASRVVWMLPPHAEKEYFRAGWAYFVEQYLPHGDLMEAVLDSANMDDRVREAFRERMAEGAEHIERHIRHGQQIGVYRSDLDAPATALWLDFMSGWGLSRLKRSDYDIDRIVTALTDVYWKSMH